ncbi:unnamed protein product, partial [Coregonus sp. 'balchen']
MTPRPQCVLCAMLCYDQDILVDLGGEVEKWSERRRIHMTSMLGGFKEADIIPCSQREPGEVEERKAQRGAVLKVSEDSALTTLNALKTRIRDLEKQLSRGDRYKCLICMGAKKLCPQCNTITSPGDLRR